MATITAINPVKITVAAFKEMALRYLELKITQSEPQKEKKRLGERCKAYMLANGKEAIDCGEGVAMIGDRNNRFVRITPTSLAIFHKAGIPVYMGIGEAEAAVELGRISLAEITPFIEVVPGKTFTVEPK